MAVLVIIESQEGIIKKTGLELASYGRAIADARGISLIAVGFNLYDHQVLNEYGVDKFYNIDTKGDKFFDVESYSSSIANIPSTTTMQCLIVRLANQYWISLVAKPVCF